MSSDSSPGPNTKLSRLILWQLAVLIMTYTLSMAPIPFKAGALVFAVIGVVLAIKVLRVAQQTPAVVAAISSGIGSVFFGLIVGAQLIFWSETAEFEQCQAQALTARAEAQCSEEYTLALFGR